jgi:CO/xanthine dehydrogenase Mo-binding subunit
MFGDRMHRSGSDHGTGFAICNHGGSQLGAVAAEVSVDRQSGKVTVLGLAGAFDIGVVINENTAVMGIKGAMIWGLGFALLEEVDLDGHRCRTTGFSNYRIARMGDIPPIEVRFTNTVTPGQPRGCGEAPAPPTIAAIANAVYDAIGIRFYELPITPARVKAALDAQA